MSDIVELLRSELRRSGRSPWSIAKETGLNLSVVYRLMDGKTQNPRGVTIDKLTKWLGKRIELREGPRYDTPESVAAKLRVVPRMAVWLRQ